MKMFSFDHIAEMLKSLFSGRGGNAAIETPDTQDSDQNSSAPCPTERHDYSMLAVCIDNGHGEETPGKRSPYAVNVKNLPALYFREYLFAREVASRVKSGLESAGASVFMCVPETTDISLSMRANRANEFKRANPDKKCVFVSIHANASGTGDSWRSASGWECWTTVGKNNSDELAACLYDAADEILVPLGRKIRRHGKSRADWNPERNFTVIYRADMPAVLTENLFYDNIDDCEFLLSEEGVNAVVDLHVRGILKYARETWNM